MKLFSKYRLLPSLGAVIIMAVLLGACGANSPQRESRLILGTTSTITIHDRRVPSGIFDRVFDRVAQIEALMSSNQANYDDTEILRINRAAGREPVAVSPDTFRVIKAGIRYSEATGGAFDISVGPLVRLWGIGTPRENVPSEEEVAAVLPLIDYRRIELDHDRRTVYLPQPGMALDVGGIAKGYAVEEAARLLSEAGVQHAVLDFGGDIYTVGVRRDGDLWRIGLQNPESGRGSIIGILDSSNNAVVTSGAYERFFIEDGERYHHLFDISTGRPSRNNLTSVTAMAEDAMLADVFSTAGYILGLEEGLQIFAQLPEAEAIFVTEDRRVYATAGIQPVFRLTDDTYRMQRIDPQIGE